MLFCVVVVVINAFCYHSSGYRLLPPALPRPKEPKGLEMRRGGGRGEGEGGQRGLLQQNQTSVSRAATQTLVVSTRLTFQNERVAEQKKNVPM